MLSRFAALLLSACIISISPAAMAGALGLGDKTFRLGYATGVTRVQIVDPAGETESRTDLQPSTLVLSDWLAGGNRYWLSMFHFGSVFRASEENVGQVVTQNGVQFQIQKFIPANRIISPWLGIGMTASIDYFRKRHTMDREGFLLQRYEDRQATSFGLVLSATQEWDMSDDWSMGIQASHVVPLSNSVQATSLSLVFLYNL